MAVDAARLTADEFQRVRVLLLRHDARPGRDGIAEFDESELGGGVDDEVFREAREVRHDERAGAGELDAEVAVAHGVEAVARHALEAERARDLFTVDRVTRPGERRRAERQHVHAPPDFTHALAVAREHLEVGETPVRPEHGLRALQVRVAGEHGVAVRLGQVQQRDLHVAQSGLDLVNLVAQPEAHRRRHLIVAAPSRVEPSARVADK